MYAGFLLFVRIVRFFVCQILGWLMSFVIYIIYIQVLFFCEDIFADVGGVSKFLWLVKLRWDVLHSHITYVVAVETALGLFPAWSFPHRAFPL